MLKNIYNVDDAQSLSDWFKTHSKKEKEVWCAIYKKTTGKQTVSQEDLVRVAISYGWIDTLIKKVDEEKYAIRFNPRYDYSHWTPGNIEIAKSLIAEGKMTQQGLNKYKSSND